MSTTATTPYAAETKKDVTKPYWRAPYVEVGMMVHWYAGGVPNAPHVAIVAEVGNDSLLLHIISPNILNFIVRDGVRHHDDPKTRAAELAEAGTWNHTPLFQKLLDLADLDATGNVR